MYHRDVDLEDVRYPFWWGVDEQDFVRRHLTEFEADRVFVITDENVWRLHGEHMESEVLAGLPHEILVAPVGESAKQLSMVQTFGERMLELGATRRSLVVAFGGGVPGNMAGLVAALLFRGIRLVHLPTTLIAGLDSVISLKQAVNSHKGKNLLGAFYAPSSVCFDLSFVRTLSPREIRSGMCEMIKNALAIDPDAFDLLEAFLDKGLAQPARSWLPIVPFAIESKQRVMRNDKNERRRGLVLEYGHTLGHAIELADFARRGAEGISHGEAVGLGMIAAARIAHGMGLLARTAVERHEEMLARVGLEPTLPSELSVSEIERTLRMDNKRGYRVGGQDTYDFILLRDLGTVAGSEDLPLTPVPMSDIHAALDSLQGSSELSFAREMAVAQ